MSNPQSQNVAQKNAEKYFRQTELQPETRVKQARKKERVAVAANTARLRELRLAKEAAEKQDKDNLGAEVDARPKRVRSVVRITY
jgi:hypothetical protein